MKKLVAVSLLIASSVASAEWLDLGRDMNGFPVQMDTGFTKKTEHNRAIFTVKVQGSDAPMQLFYLADCQVAYIKLLGTNAGAGMYWTDSSPWSQIIEKPMQDARKLACLGYSNQP